MTKIKGFSKDVETTRTIPFVFSDETRDSYGTVFTAAGWDLTRFAKNPIAIYNHESWGDDPDMAIGTARAWVEGKQLLGEITFEPAELNPTADKVFRKYLAGTFKGVSVRFMPLEPGYWGEGEESKAGSKPTYYFGKRELVEISCTPIPSNKNATVRCFGSELEEDAAKGMDGFFAEGGVRTIADVEETKDETDDANVTPEFDEEYLRTMADACSALSK